MNRGILSVRSGIISAERELGTLHNASPDELRRIVVENLRCPITWSVETYGNDFVEIVLRRWARVVSRFLPYNTDGEFLFRDEVGEYYGDVADNDRMWVLLDALEDVPALAFNTSRSCNVYREQYEAECRRIVSLMIQEPIDRPKHYAIGVASAQLAMRRSEVMVDVGILAPFVTPALQAHMLWRTLADAFDRMDLPGVSNDPHPIIDEEFDARWDSLFTPSHVRVSLNALDTVGYFNGRPAEFLIFDVHYDNGIVHCFPSTSPVANSFPATLDDLQGANDRYESGRSDFYFPI